jgi:hypothetical protein
MLKHIKRIILWHVDPLTGNECETKHYTTAVTGPMTQTQQLHCNRGSVFYVQSVPRCYMQDKLGAKVSELVSWLVS